MQFFLAKTDPDTYSIDDFAVEGETEWDGVHNHQAINVIKTMKYGDQVFIYHSQSDKAVVGLAEVIGEPYHNTFDARFSWAIRLKFIRKYRPLTLSEIKLTCPSPEEFLLIRHSRLSTMSVPPKIADWLLSKLSSHEIS